MACTATTTPRKIAIGLAIILLSASMLMIPVVGAGASSYRLPVALASAASASWTTYHHDAQRSGYDAQQPAFTSITQGWSSPATVDGSVYAEPLVVGNTVVVATENDSVYSLNAATGAVIWHTHLGSPVPLSSLPCGNINPEGITGTPVIDSAAGIIYLVALIQTASQTMHHELDALNLTTGAILYRETLQVNGVDPQHHLQRGALTLLNGTIYIPFGGRFGDCTPYHGWLVGAPTSGAGPLTAFQTSTDQAGGLWQPAGASVDAAGNLYETSGNTFCNNPCTFDGGEAVFKLSPALQELDYFAPSNYANLDANDLDLGSTGPELLQNGLIFQIGKTGDGFLLKQSSLGHVGGQAFTAHVCPNLTNDAAFGGDAYVDPYIYVPCTNGLVALKLNSSAPSFSFAWQGPSVSYAGPPIVAGGLVWTIDPAGTLYALNPTTGAVVYKASIGAAAHFATPAAGDGAVFVAAKKHIYSFVSGSASTPTPTASTSPTSSPSATATATPTFTPTPTGSPTASPTPGGQLFSDNFSQDAVGSTPTGWSIAAQSPQNVSFLVANDGGHVVQHSNWGGKLVINVSVGWTDVSASVQVKTAGWGNSAQEGIAVRLQSYQHYLRLVLVGTSTLELDAIDNGVVTKLASIPFTSAGGTWYTLRLDAIGTTLTGYVNGQALMSATIPSGYASGQVGIDSNSPTEYANVSVAA